MSDSRDSFIREQRIRARKGRKGRGESSIIYLVLRVREREHLLFALVPGFVHAWFSSTRDRVVFLFVRIVVLVVVLRRRRGLQSSSSVRHDDDDISLYRLRLVTTRVSSREVFIRKIQTLNFFLKRFFSSLSVCFCFFFSSATKTSRELLGCSISYLFFTKHHKTLSRTLVLKEEEEAVEWHWPFLEEQQRE